MPHNFQFNYRITEEKLSKLTVEGSQRQEKNLASLQMGFDKQLKDKHSGNAVLVFKPLSSEDFTLLNRGKTLKCLYGSRLTFTVTPSYRKQPMLRRNRISGFP